MADFSHNAHGEVKNLTPGKKYYFRAMTSSAEGKSDRTFTLEIWCH